MAANDSTVRFSDRVDYYVRFRPGYPPQVIDQLADRIGLTPDWVIADLGSGTGISAELFLRHGNTVYGVEPNAPMRRAAERALSRYPNFRSVDGTAEQTTLPGRSMDAVVAAQAFHWFDAARTRAECLRVSRPHGKVVVLWNSRRLDASPFLREYEELLIEYGTDYERVRHDRLDRGQFLEFFGGAPAHQFSIYNAQHLTHEGLRGRLLSSSYVPAAGQPGHAEMLAALDRLFSRHCRGGRVTMEYDTQALASELC